jgi:hypothetical protein
VNAQTAIASRQASGEIRPRGERRSGSTSATLRGPGPRRDRARTCVRACPFRAGELPGLLPIRASRWPVYPSG